MKTTSTILYVVLLSGAPALSAEPKSAPAAAPPTSADKQLLDDLDNELLEGIPLPAKSRGNATQRAQDESAGEENPLGRIGEKMRAAESLIDARHASGEAQELQQTIVVDLSRLITQLEEQQSSSSASSTSQSAQRQKTSSRSMPPGQKNPGQSGDPGPSTAARQSTKELRKDEVRRAAAADAHDLMKSLWGQLPLHERNQLLQAAPEEFLPKYELLIEQYYRRLAEEQQHSQ